MPSGYFFISSRICRWSLEGFDKALGYQVLAASFAMIAF